MCHKTNTEIPRLFRGNSSQKWNKPTRKNEIDEDSLRENRKEFINNNKRILKSQKRCKSDKQNVFTEEVNKFALSANHVKEYNEPIQ